MRGNGHSSRGESESSVKLEILKASLSLIVGLVVGLAVAWYTYHLGQAKGSEGKKPGFENIPTLVNLKGTRWKVSYEDFDPDAIVSSPTPDKKPSAIRKDSPITLPTPLVKFATAEFDQFGSRITGEVTDLEGRRWIMEGAVAERRVCYIYYDAGGQRLSFGSVCLVMANDFKTMTGQWSGWAPESNQPQPRKVTLTKS